ncbi:MAG: hypothetical protein AABW45_02835 [Nanoarchaeota archaeon]
MTREGYRQTQKINRGNVEQRKIAKLLDLVKDLGNLLSSNFPNYKFSIDLRRLAIGINLPTNNIIIEIISKKISDYEDNKDKIECVIYQTGVNYKTKEFERNLIKNYDILRNEILSFLVNYLDLKLKNYPRLP